MTSIPSSAAFRAFFLLIYSPQCSSKSPSSVDQSTAAGMVQNLVSVPEALALTISSNQLQPHNSEFGLKTLLLHRRDSRTLFTREMAFVSDHINSELVK